MAPILAAGWAIISTIVVADAAMAQYGIAGATAATVLTPTILFVAAVGIVIVGCWIAYLTGLGPDKDLSRWQFVVAFLLLPIGMFVIPYVKLLPDRVLAPFMPGPVVEEVAAEAGDGSV